MVGDGRQFTGPSNSYEPNAYVLPNGRLVVYRRYRRTQIAEMTDWEPGFDMTGVSISRVDLDAGCPKPGDKIARNPSDHRDKWLVSAVYFAQNFEELA